MPLVAKVTLGRHTRRIYFNKKEEAALNWATLKQKIFDVFRTPGLNPELFRVTYQDDEDDQITLTTDGELVEALNYATNKNGTNFLRLTILLKDNSNAAAVSIENPECSPAPSVTDSVFLKNVENSESDNFPSKPKDARPSDISLSGLLSSPRTFQSSASLYEKEIPPLVSPTSSVSSVGSTRTYSFSASEDLYVQDATTPKSSSPNCPSRQPEYTELKFLTENMKFRAETQSPTRDVTHKPGVVADSKLDDNSFEEKSCYSNDVSNGHENTLLSQSSAQTVGPSRRSVGCQTDNVIVIPAQSLQNLSGELSQLLIKDLHERGIQNLFGSVARDSIAMSHSWGPAPNEPVAEDSGEVVGFAESASRYYNAPSDNVHMRQSIVDLSDKIQLLQDTLAAREETGEPLAPHSYEGTTSGNPSSVSSTLAGQETHVGESSVSGTTVASASSSNSYVTPGGPGSGDWAQSSVFDKDDKQIVKPEPGASVQHEQYFGHVKNVPSSSDDGDGISSVDEARVHASATGDQGSKSDDQEVSASPKPVARAPVPSPSEMFQSTDDISRFGKDASLSSFSAVSANVGKLLEHLHALGFTNSAFNKVLLQQNNSDIEKTITDLKTFYNKTA